MIIRQLKFDKADLNITSPGPTLIVQSEETADCFRVQVLEFRVQDSGCRIQCSGFQSSGFSTQVLEIRVQASGFSVSGFKVQSSGFRIQVQGFRGSESRVQGLQFRFQDSEARRRKFKFNMVVTKLKRNYLRLRSIFKI